VAGLAQDPAPDVEPAGPRGNHGQGRGGLGASHGWAVTPGRTRASVWRTPCPGALCASRAWTWGTPDRTLTLPPRHPGYATQKATPLRERAATGPLRNPSQHSSSLGRQDPSLAPDSGGPIETRRRNDSDGRAGGVAPVTKKGPGRKPERGPGLRMERGGAGVARREAGSHIMGPIRGAERSSCQHVMRRAPPRWDRPPAPGSQRADRCMQPGRRQGNKMPGRWTGA
jgi:hypothetical protein